MQGEAGVMIDSTLFVLVCKVRDPVWQVLTCQAGGRFGMTSIASVRSYY